jgi:imidazolonepropionase-like amidohydrolase
MRVFPLPFLGVSLALVVPINAFAQTDPGAPNIIAITDARIVLASGNVVEKGTLVLRDGRIEAVGAGVAAPPDARTIPGTGLTLYPGLVSASSRLGMPAAADYPAVRGDSYPLATVRAEQSAAALFKPDPAAALALRRLGFGATLAAPSAGIFPGQSAVFSLADANDASALLLRADIFQHLQFTSGGEFGAYPGSLMGQIAVARQVLLDARVAPKSPSGRPLVSRALASLQGVVSKRQPLAIAASGSAQIERALHLSREFGLTPTIEGGTDGYAVIDALKAAGASVLLSTDLPAAPTVAAGETSTETLQSLRRRALAPTTAAALARAGIPFALVPGTPADFARNVRRMIAAGLSEDAALTALTLSPARLLGVEKELGTLAPGKLGDVIAVEGGSLFSPNAKIKYLFVDGKEVTPPTAPEAPAAPPGRRPGPAAPAAPPLDVAKLLPPGVSRDEAIAFLKASPDAAKPFLPAGVTPEQALAALEGREPAGAPAPAPQAPAAAAETAPPTVGTTLIPALPTPVAKTFVLRGATVWTSGPTGVLKAADVLVKDGKIVAVGATLAVPSGTQEIDAKGKHITPGMIDCHSHTAIAGGVNEGSNSVTAECRIEDVIDAEDVNIYRQLAGGTTAANLLHGSANAIGGQNAVVKWRWGADADGLKLVGAPAGIKFALGENPTRSNGGIPTSGERRYPGTRMGVERVIRERFLAGRDYLAAWKAFRDGRGPEPRRDLQLEAIGEILEGKRLVHCHSYRADEILTMTRLAEEFGFTMATFQHVLEGYKVADELAKHGVGGSTFSDWWGFKIEANEAIPFNGALMTERGVVVSFNSDSSELARRMNLEAAKAVRWGGLAPAEALKLVTINPARQLRIDRMTGSLEAGKDADIVVWSGDPLSAYSVCEKTFVDGTLRFDRVQDLAARAAQAQEKERLAKALDPAPANAPARTAAASSTRPAAASVWPTPPTRPAPSGPVTALVGGTVHPVSGPTIAGGVVVFQGDRIVAVGPAATTKIPGGAKRIDVAGKHVYPGFFDADTTLGANEIDSRRETQDYREIGPFSPELRIAHAVNPDSEAIRVARTEGVLNAVTAPAGGTLSGMAAVLNLDGWTWEELAIAPAAGLSVTFPTLGQRRFRETAHRCEETAGSPDDALLSDPAFRSDGFVPAGSLDTDALRLGLLPETAQGTAQPPSGGRRPGGGRPGGPAAPGGAPATDDNLKPLNDFLIEAQRYRTARLAEGKGGAPVPRDTRLEAMLPVLTGAVPLLVRADLKRDIEGAVVWGQANGFRVVIVGGQEADQCSELLAKEKIPVILGPVLNLPPRFDSAYDDAYTLPARLAKAGVTFALSTGDSVNVRRLPNQAAMAAAYGLDRDEALKAITLNPARILGLGDRLGAIEVGKDANVIVTTGDALEITSRVTAAFVAGNAVDLGNKQTNLYAHWRSRPRKR